MKITVAEVRKALVAALALASQLLAAGVLPSRTAVIVSAVLAVAGAYGVYRVPNKGRQP